MILFFFFYLSLSSSLNLDFNVCQWNLQENYKHDSVALTHSFSLVDFFFLSLYFAVLFFLRASLGVFLSEALCWCSFHGIEAENMKNKEMMWRRGEHETINHVWRKREQKMRKRIKSKREIKRKQEMHEQSLQFLYELSKFFTMRDAFYLILAYVWCLWHNTHFPCASTSEEPM